MRLFSRSPSSLSAYCVFALRLMLLWWMSLSGVWAAQNHVVETAYWEDPCACTAPEQAKIQTYTRYEGILSRGYSKSATWVKFRIDPAGLSHDQTQLIIRIRPVYLDSLVLYDPLDEAGKPRLSGDQIEFDAEEYRSLTHTFVVPAGQQPRDLWLRITTTSTKLALIEAYSQQDMQRKEFELMLLYFFVLSVIMLFLTMVFINWLQYRDFLYAAFAVRQILFMAFVLCNDGFHRMALSHWCTPIQLDQKHNWLAIAVTGFSIWFESRFLWEYAPPLWARNSIRGLMLWSGLTFVLMGWGEINRSLHLNMMLNAVSVVVLLILSSIFINDQTTQMQRQSAPISALLKKRIVVTYYVFVGILLGLSVLPSLGLLRGTELAVNALVLYALTSGAMMTILMQLRANQLRKTSLQAQQALNLQIQRTNIEREKRQEQSQLLAMLMHEIKNPLAVIDLAQQSIQDQPVRDYISRNVLLIKNILDRCIHADRLDDGKLTTHLQDINLIQVIQEIINAHPDASSRIEIQCADPSLMLHSDLQCLSIILSNLIDNALRYSNPQYPIHLEINKAMDKDQHDAICIRISNRPGLADWPEPQHVFKKYYRSAGAKKRSGTGLGLYLVETLAQTIGAHCIYVPDAHHVRFELWIPN